MITKEDEELDICTIMRRSLYVISPDSTMVLTIDY